MAFGGFRIPLAGPDDGKPSRVIVGVRPEAFEDASLADASLPQIEVQVDVVEDLGPDTHVIFQVDSPPVDVTEVREAAGDEDASCSRSIGQSSPHVSTHGRLRAPAGRSRSPSILRGSTSSIWRPACGSSMRRRLRWLPLSVLLAAPALAAPASAAPRSIDSSARWW